MIDLHPIDSSNLRNVGYDKEKAELVVQFRGGEKYYVYSGVSPDLHAELIGAKSPGSLFREKILGKFEHRKAEAPP